MAVKHYLFDIDNTLTPSRAPIDPDFAEFFLDFCYSHSVALVTGSDYATATSQLGSAIVSRTKLFACNGNVLYSYGAFEYSKELYIPTEMLRWFVEQLDKSQFHTKTNSHITLRDGSVNFSILGRNGDLGDRRSYIQWDKLSNERLLLAQNFNNTFPGYTALVGGETGIDISYSGANKAQVLDHYPLDDVFIFFGDAMYENGNDYPLAQLIERRKRGLTYTVDSWKKTHEILQYLK